LGNEPRDLRHEIVDLSAKEARAFCVCVAKAERGVLDDPFPGPDHRAASRDPPPPRGRSPHDHAERRARAQARSVRVDALAVAATSPLLHNATLTLGRIELHVIDLAVWDPRLPPPPPRAVPPRAAVYDRASRRAVDVKFITSPLTLVGSSPACDLVVEDMPDIAYAIWLRGDGLLEVQLLDSSKLPYGETVQGASIVCDFASFEISAARVLIVTDRASLDGLPEALPMPSHWRS